VNPSNFAASTTVSSQWTTGSSLIYYNGGNVGIGTSSPSNRLEVSGNTFLGGNLTATGTISQLFSTGSASFGVQGSNYGLGVYSTTNIPIMQVGTDSSHALQFYWTPIGATSTGSGYFGTVTNTNPLSFGGSYDSFVANAGFGESGGVFTPNYPVDIRGSGGNEMAIQNMDNANGTYASLLFKTGSNSGTSYYKTGIFPKLVNNTADIADLNFAVNTSVSSTNVGLSDTRLTISGTNGFVGIGTTSPATKLDVNGNVTIENANGIIMRDTVTGSCYIIKITSGLVVPTASTTASC
jgi:hypothetical protein